MLDVGGSRQEGGRVWGGAFGGCGCGCGVGGVWFAGDGWVSVSGGRVVLNVGAGVADVDCGECCCCSAGSQG